MKDFTTSKSDAAKGITKKPGLRYLQKDEELFSDGILSQSSEIRISSSSQYYSHEQISGSEERCIDDKMRSRSIYSKNEEEKVGLRNFEKLKMIGKGTFGKVHMVENITDGKIYAMKSIRKDKIIDNDHFESTQMEKQILMNNEHPFLIKMSYVFQSKHKVYFVMDFIRGGELYTHLNNEKKFAEDKARFYALQIIMSIGYLHQQDIVYRDVKPENILIGEDGYLHLADFGLTKSIKRGELATTFCGTHEYLAPEIIKQQGYCRAVDWWACGILIYDMIVGMSPFIHKNQSKMYELIEKAKVRFPDRDTHGIEMSSDVKNLICKLLTKDPKKRLGSKGGMEEIISHAWFKDVDIDKLLKKQLAAPFVPTLGSDARDVSNFDRQFTSSKLEDSIIPQRGIEAIERYKSMFKDFDE